MYYLKNTCTGEYYAGVYKDKLFWNESNSKAVRSESKEYLVGVVNTLCAVFHIKHNSFEIVWEDES